MFGIGVQLGPNFFNYYNGHVRVINFNNLP